MRMMKRLLDNLGKSWEKTPKYKPVIEVQQGTGTHFMYTIEDNQLHFHSTNYNEDLPIKQSIVLEDLSLQELVDTINSMGYVVKLTSEADMFTARKSFTLMPVKNRTIITVAEISTFTSKMWETLYPIARLLHDTENDMDKAIAEMFATSTKGKWLEYWASFFDIKRNVGEGDSLLSRRIFMTLVNLKTNNLAIEELVQFAIQSDAKVEDVEPARFQVVVSPEYIDRASTVTAIIEGVKGAGIDYFLNYSKLYDEDYRAYFRDKESLSFSKSDTNTYSSSIRLNEAKLWYTDVENHPWFSLNVHKLNSGTEILDEPEPIIPIEDRDIHSVEFERDFGMETYNRLHYIGEIFTLNASALNATSEVLFDTYHSADFGDKIVGEYIGNETFTTPTESYDYGNVELRESYIEPKTLGDYGFMMNRSLLVGSAKLSVMDTRYRAVASMKLEDTSGVLRQETIE